MVVRSSDTCVDALQPGIMQSIHSQVDILLHCTCQSTKSRFSHDFRYLHYGLVVARTGNRKTTLDDIHLHSLEHLCKLDLLNRIQLTSWHLLTISERRIKYV